MVIVYCMAYKDILKFHMEIDVGVDINNYQIQHFVLEYTHSMEILYHHVREVFCLKEESI